MQQHGLWAWLGSSMQHGMARLQHAAAAWLIMLLNNSTSTVVTGDTDFSVNFLGFELFQVPFSFGF